MKEIKSFEEREGEKKSEGRRVPNERTVRKSLFLNAFFVMFLFF